MSLETTQIQDKLVETFGESVFHFNQEKDLFSLEVATDKITAVILFLKNDIPSEHQGFHCHLSLL